MEQIAVVLFMLSGVNYLRHVLRPHTKRWHDFGLEISALLAVGSLVAALCHLVITQA